ncbi:hypothetical protein [Agrococcus sp. SGAir0287]|uniref:hypothetical protein n=1 Tax=Agrococcus sp. SGAir0287 TaxID=2070347 RepID=UPI0010CD46D1|nr:hypothetical protein [Agrococcus sp. SGAir0287]QCR19096.1 hypothetical protein C1N71_06280 [Agrococcus sp. SGAir0287]
MTDYDGPPLTRRERKERERALAEATGQTPPVAAPIAEPSTPTAEPEQAPEPAETEAIDVSELIADLRPQSTPAPEGPVAGVPASGEARVQEAREADAAAAEAEQGSSSGFGRFFGRRGPAQDSTDEPAQQHESIADVFADLQGDRPEPTRPAGTPMPRIEVDDLDPVDDAEVDRLEIDEVEVADARVSSRRIADSTPAQLEDRRQPAVDDEDEEEVRTGPARATGRIPVIVNVVEDTSRHHIADLRDDDTSAISASSVGTGTSTITANALVLPASGAHEPITVETADGVIVTGSIDLPDGFASSGRSRGTIDTAEVDAVDDAGEVRSPETQPVRASRAVSSYANARVRIAPQRRSRNATPIVIGVAGGIGIVAVGATVVAFIAGWI